MFYDFSEQGYRQCAVVIFTNITIAYKAVVNIHEIIYCTIILGDFGHLGWLDSLVKIYVCIWSEF